MFVRSNNRTIELLSISRNEHQFESEKIEGGREVPEILRDLRILDNPKDSELRFQLETSLRQREKEREFGGNQSAWRSPGA